MATVAQIKQRIAEDLSLVPTGQTVQNQHLVRIAFAYDEVFAELKDSGDAVWTSTGEVPSRMVPHVVARCAFNCISSGSFGVSKERYQRIQLANAEAKREIPKLSRPAYESLGESVDY